LRKRAVIQDTTAVHPPRPGTAAGARFLLAITPGSVRLHALPHEGEAIIGRGAGCHVVLDHAAISREHARLRLGATCTLADLSSRHGTLLRGERLSPGEERPIAYGDSFSVGPMTLLLVPAAAEVPAGAGADSLLRVEDPGGEAPSPLLTAVAQARLNVTIQGETGAGKEVLAATLHRLSGRRGPLLAINCAALTESLLESQLFGHERGAFTGAVQTKPGLLAAASAGTLLLDEVGEMPAALQAKVLRAIETHTILPVGGVQPVPIDVRFLAATHRDLLADVEAGRFRRDLYYRLTGFTLFVPPLRERRDQIVRLALTLVTAAAARAGTPAPALTPAALERLERHDWPGNVRQLRNVLERSMALAQGSTIDAGQLLFDPPAADAPRSPAGDERARILEALDACAGNQTRAARRLGISRTTLLSKLALHGIRRPRNPR
jgi:two-component system response regulator AtoC